MKGDGSLPSRRMLSSASARPRCQVRIGTNSSPASASGNQPPSRNGTAQPIGSTASTTPAGSGELTAGMLLWPVSRAEVGRTDMRGRKPSWMAWRVSE